MTDAKKKPEQDKTQTLTLPYFWAHLQASL